MSRHWARLQKWLQTLVPFSRYLPLVLMVLMASTSVYAQSDSFPEGTNYAVPGRGGIAVGDFNGDKVPDIVIANGDGTVSILLGNGDGTFQPQYLVTAVPTSSSYLTEYVAVGDFNGGGYPDLAVLCVSSLNNSLSSSVTGSVNILLNKGDGTGTFGAPTVIPLQGTGPLIVQAAHFGNDTNYDLAVLNAGSENVSILLGNGNGTFQTEVDYTTNTQPVALAIGDLNKDGYVDLAVAGANGSDGVVSVLLGVKGGTFGGAVDWITTGSCTETCEPPSTVAIGDFNGDGREDIAVNDGFVGGIFVLLGNGDGSFQTPPVHSANAASGQNGQNFLVAGDWNGDGKLDLAMAVGRIYPSFADLMIYPGNGDGTFPFPITASVGAAGTFAGATAVVTADFNGDGFKDLALATNTGFAPGLGYNAVTVALNCGLKCSATALSSSVPSSSFNQPVTFTATVTPANAKATINPTGSVIFQDVTQVPPTALGTGTLSAREATLVTSSLVVGAHSISASYEGDANFIPSTSAVITVSVTQASTNTAISSSADPSAPGQSVTFTATVTPSTSGVPTGTVVFSDNGTQSVSATLDSTGSATFATSSLNTSTHSIMWSYSGDTNFAASTSPVLTQIVGTNAAPFALSSSAMSATVSAGQSAMFTITIASVPTFRSAITFSCSGLPVGANCTFTPSQLTPSSATAMTSLAITTTGSRAVVQQYPALPILVRSETLSGAFGLLALVLLVASRTQTRQIPLARLAAACIFIVLSAAIGCGKQASSTSPTAPTPSGTSQIMVIGSSASTTQSMAISLTVN